MPRGINQIDHHVTPRHRHTRRVDRDAPFLLFGVIVGRGGPFVDITHAMRRTAVVEHPLGERRFAGVNMGNNADVSQVFDFPSHELLNFHDCSMGAARPCLGRIKNAAGKSETANPKRSDAASHYKNQLPREMSKRLVGVCHSVNVLSPCHRGTFTIVSGEQLIGHLLMERPPLLFANRDQQPANR